MVRATDYEINCKNHVDYEIVFKLYTKNKFLENMFGKTLKTYKKKMNRPNLKVDVEKVRKFDIPQKFYILLENATSKTFKDIKKDIGKDKIIIISGKVRHANFSRDEKDDWIITITMGGHYVDKR